MEHPIYYNINMKVFISGIFSLPDVEENNTLFIHVLLYQCFENLEYLTSLLETACCEIPEINNIILIKRPEIQICKRIFRTVHKDGYRNGEKGFIYKYTKNSF